MRPLHPRNLESDITFMQNGGGHTMDTMREHVERRLACSAKVLALLSSDSDAPDARLPDPLVFVTGERSLPTSVFLPHALEGSADNISAADLCAWARVCSAWAGWVRRLLADPSSLRWLWARLVESHIQEAGISCLRHPELSTRSTLRVLLSEQRERDEGTTAAMDALAGEDVEMADPSKVWPSEVAGGVADLFAFFANFFDAPDIEYEERARPHCMLSDLAFRPYLSAQGEYAAPEAAWEMRDMVVDLCDIVREYSEWVRESEDVSQNLILSTILLPQLRSIVCSLMTFLEIDDTSQQDGHPRSLTVRASPFTAHAPHGHMQFVHCTLFSPSQDEAHLRAAVTDDKAAKLAAALRGFACFFPSRADVERTARGRAIHAGRFEEVLVSDPAGGFRFHVLEPASF